MVELRDLERECKALGHVKRIRIIALLRRRRTASVGEIAQHIHCTLPTASHHIHALKNAGVVRDRRRGMFVLYELSPKPDLMTRALLSAITH